MVSGLDPEELASDRGAEIGVEDTEDRDRVGARTQDKERFRVLGAGSDVAVWQDTVQRGWERATW